MPTTMLDIVNAAIGAELPPMRFRYDERDVALYALGIGAPADPLAPQELRFVYELSPQFQVIPTFAALFARELIAQLMTGSIAGINFEPMMLLHGMQCLDLLRPLPPSATVISRARIAEIHDKGSGMLIHVDVDSATDSGEKLCSARTSVFIRGIGSYGGERGASLKLPSLERAPDLAHEEATSPTQALLYRLAGDANPLHADPAMAARGGYPAPILHGLCTFGFAARAIIKRCCGNDARKLSAISARFSSHVFPGETLVTEIWRQPDNEIRFQTRTRERGDIALSDGCAALAD